MKSFLKLALETLIAIVIGDVLEKFWKTDRENICTWVSFLEKKYEKLATLFKGDTSQGIFLCLLQI